MSLPLQRLAMRKLFARELLLAAMTLTLDPAPSGAAGNILMRDLKAPGKAHDPESAVLLGQVGKDNCLSTKCHPEMGKAKYVHGPVAVGICTVCHRTSSGYAPEKHHAASFTSAARGKDLCFICHEPPQGKFTHGPIAKGDCIPCHDPHQSDAQYQMRRPTIAALCFTCHEDNKTNVEFPHDPVAAGDCSVCHKSHASDYPHHLVDEITPLCVSCHDTARTRMHIDQCKSLQCRVCHNPHGSNRRNLLE